MTISLIKGYFIPVIVQFVSWNYKQIRFLNDLKAIAFFKLFTFSLVMLSLHLRKSLHLSFCQKHHYLLPIFIFIFFLKIFYLFFDFCSHTLYDSSFYCILCLCESISIFIIKLDVEIILHAPCCKSHVFQDKAQGMLFRSS